MNGVKLAVRSKKKAFCVQNCLAGEDICLWLYFLREGDFQKAWEEIIKINPLPAITGKICPHPCEVFCKRNLLDDSLSISELENFLGEEALRKDWPLPVLNKETREEKIAIIGSGPAGLSCAYQLALRGYKVTIFEQLSVIGGLLRVGIPEFRLPKDLLEEEIKKNILSLGIEIKTNFMVDKDIFSILRDEFDAFFFATGLQKSRKLNIFGEEQFLIYYGLEFLFDLNLGRLPKLGKKVIVIGGGNTAIDVARSAKRLGLETVIIFYRRTKAEMPAIESEIIQAEKDRIEIRELVAPIKIFSQERKKFLECQRMRLGELDESGRRRPIPIEGSNFLEEFDDLIVAVGEEAEKEKIDLLSLSQDEKVFIGGDILTQAGTVAAAIKSGREKAEEIDRFLWRKRRVEFEELASLSIRLDSLDFCYTPQKGLKYINSPVEAQEEAKRCFSCDLEIEGLAEILINQEKCKGCGLCLAVCPYQLIEPSRSINSQGYYPVISQNSDACRGCRFCVLMCPDVAIEICKGGVR